MILEFRVLPGVYAVARLPPTQAIPDWATQGEFISITRTAEELSIICAAEGVPSDVHSTGGWRCLGALGPFAFSEIGVAAEFTSVLAKRAISVLVVSTHDTDYLLVSAEKLESAVDALAAAGHRITR